MAEPTSWIYSTRGIAIRLFLTCWLIYTAHFATNTVREIYPALALGDHLSFRVDEYANMHPDLFEKEGYGWHIGNNPGASMIAAIPYALARPIIDPIIASVNRSRAASGLTEPPSYNSPWPMAREFYAEAWRRGYDIKFGMASFVMQGFAMAPVTALGVVFMFYLLRLIFTSDKTAFWLSLLFAFGTPVFFRTGYLNQNLMLGIFTFIGLITMWNPSQSERLSQRMRYFIGGLAGGAALLFDYSGVVLLLGLFAYGFIKQWRETRFKEAVHLSAWYILGSIGPVALLWLYQWRSFGNPFLPGQHWMPPVEWIELGYQGYGLPQLELFLMLGFDHRFGFFVTSPLMLLALVTPFIERFTSRKLPKLEMYFILVLFLAFLLFFSGSNYTRLQFNTGIRYMTPMFPFMFLLAAVTLVRLPRIAIGLIAIASVVESWSLAMYRDVEKPLGVLDPIVRTFLGGLRLPALSTISRLESQFGNFIPNGVSPLPIFAFLAALVFVIWSPSIWGGD
jgi:hypothetical protein